MKRADTTGQGENAKFDPLKEVAYLGAEAAGFGTDPLLRGPPVHGALQKARLRIFFGVRV